MYLSSSCCYCCFKLVFFVQMMMCINDMIGMMMLSTAMVYVLSDGYNTNDTTTTSSSIFSLDRCCYSCYLSLDRTCIQYLIQHENRTNNKSLLYLLSVRRCMQVYADVYRCMQVCLCGFCYFCYGLLSQEWPMTVCIMLQP